MSEGYWRITSLGIDKMPLPIYRPDPGTLPGKYVGLGFYSDTLEQARDIFAMQFRGKPRHTPHIKYAAFTASRKSAIVNACTTFAEAVAAPRKTWAERTDPSTRWACANCFSFNAATDAWCYACGNAAPSTAKKPTCTNCKNSLGSATARCYYCGHLPEQEFR